jgi:hypothetical protein
MKFYKDGFHYHGGYLTYGSDRKFVARFKHRGGVGKADFVRLLCKYYTQEEYFARVANEAPLRILENDGFVSFNLVDHRILVSR